MLTKTEKIIQIFAIPASKASETEYFPVLYGLSNEGRLFFKNHGERNWSLLNNGIPNGV